MRSALRGNAAYWFSLCLSLAGYIALGYFTPRENFHQLFALFAMLFALYAFILRASSRSDLLVTSVVFSMVFRGALLFMLPNLSDDYFRFLWDGRMLAHGINPFSALPSALIDAPGATAAGLNHALYDAMNSPLYHTIYPPAMQFIFYLSAKIFPHDILGSVIVMRLFILAAEAGSLFLIAVLLKRFSLPAKNILLYALNPLVIIELTGNLHFEALMIFFMLLSVFLLLREQIVLSAVTFAFAVCAKLLPLMFLPLLLKKTGWRYGIMYCAVCSATFALLFIPFLDEALLANLFSSVNLYFEMFEFNASIFYAVRWAGFQTVGYDIIHQAGAALSAIAALLILAISFFYDAKKTASVFHAMLFSLFVYFLFATIVHPWYVTSLVALCLFTQWRFPIVWSAMIVLTYFTYRTVPYAESLALVTLEYAVVVGYMLLETREKLCFPYAPD